ncbi:Prenylated rab acceptor PRA1 [Dillenia turbinata]|uniref:PRA1 family protein n=1 Tax=Dillenia turbinata TaxID=194707 RepID=A0AAN8ZP12_9MAGN
MTTYGTIPTSTPPSSSNLEYISRAKERLRSSLGTRKPWKELVNLRSINLPTSFGEALLRIRTNLAYFRTNYVIISLIILFLSLLWHPISLIVFIIMMAAWLFLYFLRDQQLVLFNFAVDDRLVLLLLSALTIGFLLLTDVTVNIIVSIVISIVLVLVHGAIRRTDDLFADEESSFSFSGGGFRGSGARVPLRETASSDFYTASPPPP